MVFGDWTPTAWTGRNKKDIKGGENKMTPEEWKEIVNFKPEENFGNPEMMNYKFMKFLDRFRAELRIPMIITCGTQGKHVTNSYHYQGRAVDFYLDTKMSLGAQVALIMDRLMETSLYYNTGLGVYPDWSKPGFHLDNRDYYARWGYKDGKELLFQEILEYV